MRLDTVPYDSSFVQGDVELTSLPLEMGMGEARNRASEVGGS